MDESRYQAILEAAPFGYAYHEVITDPAGSPVDYRFIEANRAFARLTGLDAEGVVGRTVTEVIPGIEESEFDWIGRYGAIGLGGGAATFEQYSEPLGRWYEVQVQSAEKGYFTTLFVDVTERKRTLSELEKQANYIESLFAAIPDLTFVLDAEGTFLDARAGRDEEFFVSREAFIGRNVIDLFPEPAAGALKEAITRAVRDKTHASVPYELPREDGIGTFEARLTPIDDDRVIGMVRDITGSARAQQALEKRDTLLKKLSREVPGAIYQYRYAPNRSSWFPFMSDGIRDVYELMPEDVMTDASPILERVHPHDRDRLKHSIRESFETLCLWTCEYRVNLPSKGERWLQGSANPERLDDGSVLWHGYLTDVTERKRIEGELRDSEQRFDLAIAGTGAGLWDWDMVNDRVYFSPRWKAMLGYSDSEVENSLDGWRTLWHPDDVESIEQAIQQHLDGETSTYEIEHRVRARNGEWRRILTRGELVRDESGVPIRWVGTNIDLTHTREMEDELVRSRQHLASVVQTQQEMISRFLPDTTLTFVNDAYCRFFARTREELIGSRFVDSVPEDQRDAVEASFADLCAEHPARTYSQLVTAPDGTKVWQEWNDQAIIGADGSVVEIQSTARDITMRVEAQQELVAAKEAAETANQAKSQFLANMSHEIRTPLNGVIGFTDLLLQTPLDPVQRQYAESANTSGASLLAIINDILDFSKIEAGKLDLEIVRTDLVELVEQAADIITYHAAKKNLELLVHLDPAMPRYVYTDPGRLKQVLTNLLSNAMKFTERGEVEIKVEFDAMTTGRGRYRFAVRDTGIGIRADQKARLFKAFSQADSSTTRKFGGTGLGLIISNLLAEKMGGRIEVESAFGVGSVFQFAIDVDCEYGSKESRPASPPVDRVLVVDDNANNRLILERSLAHWGVRCTCCADGLSAMKELEDPSSSFDAMIVDYLMPYLDGIETVRMIREKLGITPESLPVILLHSSSEDQVFRNECESLGIRARLVKPAKTADLYNALRNVDPARGNAAAAPADPSSASTVGDRGARARSQAKVLIAEDVAMNMLLVKTLVAQFVEGVEILEASNGAEAVRIAQSTRIDLILMDIQMPELDGVEATRRIRAAESDGARRVPIVALTAGALLEEREKCLSAGMDDFLTKPIRPSQLSALLESYVQPASDASDEEPCVHFDRAGLLRRSENNQLLFAEMMKSAHIIGTLVTRLGEYVRVHDEAGILRTAHSIKGSSKTIGFDELARLQELVEASAEDADAISQTFEQVQLEWNHLEGIIDEELLK